MASATFFTDGQRFLFFWSPSATPARSRSLGGRGASSDSRRGTFGRGGKGFRIEGIGVTAARKVTTVGVFTPGPRQRGRARACNARSPPRSRMGTPRRLRPSPTGRSPPLQGISRRRWGTISAGVGILPGPTTGSMWRKNFTALGLRGGSAGRVHVPRHVSHEQGPWRLDSGRERQSSGSSSPNSR